MSENSETSHEQPVPEPRRSKVYRDSVMPELMVKLGRKNRLSVPRVEKIVLNMGVGRAVEDRKLLDQAVEALRIITGQQPALTRARKSIAGFHLREGVAIGCKVTLRDKRMFEFLDRLISVVLPRIRDFRGLSPDSFDGAGNYSLGINEHIVFPEVNLDDVETIFGMDVTICTTAKTDQEAHELLAALGMPFRGAEART